MFYIWQIGIKLLKFVTMVYLLQWFMIGLSLSKDLYLVITLKLILCFSWKAPALFMKSTYTFCEKLLKTNKNSWFNTDLSFWLGLSQSTEGRPTRYILIFGGVWSEKWMKSIWKAYEKHHENERPLARNCNPLCFILLE